jgi:translation initiation factor 6 (eIF-6)
MTAPLELPIEVQNAVNEFQNDLGAVLEKHRVGQSIVSLRLIGGTLLGAGIGALVVSKVTDEELDTMVKNIREQAKLVNR